MLRWFWDNKGSLLLSFALAVTVWVASVVAQDPTLEQVMEESVPITYTAPDEGLLVVGNPPSEARVTIKAPESVWNEISLETISISVDLSGLDAAIYRMELNPDHGDLKPLRIISVEPDSVRVKLEPLLSKELPVTVRLIGDPALTYDIGDPLATPEAATVVGPSSLVTQVVELRAEVNLAGASQSIDEFIPLQAVDESGELVEGVDISPDPIGVFVPVAQGDRYRLLSVIPDLVGSPAFGYRTVAFIVIPNEVLVTSSDLTAFDTLAGFLDTETIDITGATETVDQNVLLSLPEGIFPVQDQTVRVIVTIQPIETSKAYPDLAFEIQGLSADLAAIPSPDRVTLLLNGPLAILDELQAEDIRVVLNLLDLDIGIYDEISPEITLPEGVTLEEISPPTVSVEIIVAPPATPEPTP
jgi:YbbR domain-containing protein